jgi:glycosyltransferase involved in cell wall biosynthesis
MRVAFTIEQSWHRVPGGTAVAALELARELSGRPGVELVGVAARHREPPPEPWRPPIPVRHLPLPQLVLYESWHYLGRPRVERATGPVDVIHATGVAIPPRSAPLVVTVHDLSYLVYPKHFSRAGLRFFRRALKLVRVRADLVLCSSEATLEHCVQVGLPRERLRHVPLGVQIDRADDADVARVRERYGLAGPYVLWTGTVEPRKNLPGLLAAWERLRTDAELVLVGPRGWNEELRLPAGVKTLGFVPGDDLRALYAGAEAFCFPSLMEGFGFPVIEAMAQGTPVITSAGTSTEELARDAGLLVDPRDPGAIAAALRRVLSDPSLAAELREAGARRAAEYTGERNADLVLAAYEEARARGRASRSERRFAVRSSPRASNSRAR